MADAPQIVGVLVEELLPFGLLVRLEDGTQGLVRERELAWEYHVRRRWREHFKPGDRIEAVVIEPGQHHQRAELSVRLAKGDPWTTLDPAGLLGRIERGTVTGVQPYGAFVEIRPGIVGLLHQSRLPTWLQRTAMAELFWVGDQVQVMVERVDLARRQIALSLSRALYERWPETAETSARLSGHGRAREGETAPETPPAMPEPITCEAGEPIELSPATWRILVIEDDQTQREALAGWLKDQGHQVFGAASAEAGLDLLEQEPIELLLTDYGLQGELSGVDAVMAALARRPALRCALMTDWARASVASAEVARVRARGVPLLVKPLRPADVAGLLLERDLPLPADHADTTAETAEAPMSLGYTAAGPHNQHTLHPTLARVRKALKASRVVLFALDPARRHVELVAEAGNSPASAGPLDSLIYSPVRDVAEDGITFRVEDSARGEHRARYLRAFMSFQSCIAVPVVARLPRRFALFAFSGREHAFAERHEEQLAVAALALAATLEHAQFLSRAADTQRLALLGQLSSALVHELNHVLTAMNFTLPNIEQLLAVAPQRCERDEALLQMAFADLRRGVERLTSTARMFGRVTIHAGPTLADLGQILHESVELLRDLADRQHVTLDLHAAPGLPSVATPSAPLQQILLNIMLNAVQQIGLARPGQTGRVVVGAELRATEHGRLVQVRVEDDGPGIHRQLWERIFELGFTTRHENGSGLGLYISRSLAEALGLHVRVAESYLGWGTTFVVEIPESASDEEEAG